MLIPERRRKMTRIPLISLIDMTFMLFIFFILITRFSDFEQIELNTATHKEGANVAGNGKEETLMLRLGKQGAYMGDTLVPYAKIMETLRPYMPQYTVVIETGWDADVQQMVQALDAAKLAGAREITLKGMD